jgi:YD repeat-containing protein
VVDPVGGRTRTVFEQDRPTKVTQIVGEPDAPGGESNDLVTTLEYDARGNVLRAEQPGGQVQRISYGPHGEPLTVTDALGNTTHNTFDERGNLIFSDSPTGVASAFEYDDKGNLRTATQNGTATTIAYTPEGTWGKPFAPRIRVAMPASRSTTCAAWSWKRGNRTVGSAGPFTTVLGGPSLPPTRTWWVQRNRSSARRRRTTPPGA